MRCGAGHSSRLIVLHTMRLRRIRRSDVGLHVRRPIGLVRYRAHTLQTVDKSPKLGRSTWQPYECAAENRGLSGAATLSRCGEEPHSTKEA
ncbi:hypothetical protein Hamer_G016418 [Homarus americanus]|uniref:Uncharacterized protein n=1 Tax=Homarus americanus TaxID=6706 RepID=A0A8J5N7B5_HOMAM|nr:hypothetical protein Hamer_G016418 [Homarus americanus]